MLIIFSLFCMLNDAFSLANICQQPCDNSHQPDIPTPGPFCTCNLPALYKKITPLFTILKKGFQIENVKLLFDYAFIIHNLFFFNPN